MSDEYMPTTEEVLNAFGATHWGYTDAAQRWLAEHDAQVRSEVIDWIEQNLAGEDSPSWARTAYRSWLSLPAAMDVIDEARIEFGLTDD